MLPSVDGIFEIGGVFASLYSRLIPFFLLISISLIAFSTSFIIGI